MIATNFVDYEQMTFLKSIDWKYYSTIRDAWNRGEMKTADAEIIFQVWIPASIDNIEDGDSSTGETVKELRAKHAALELLLDEIFADMGQTFDPNADFSF